MHSAMFIYGIITSMFLLSVTSLFFVCFLTKRDYVVLRNVSDSLDSWPRDVCGGRGCRAQTIRQVVCQHPFCCDVRGIWDWDWAGWEWFH